MDVLFIHPNFPGQFRRLAARLAREPGYTVWGLGDAGWLPPDHQLPGVQLLTYSMPKAAAGDCHRYVRNFDGAVRRAQQAAQLLLRQKQQGFEPEVIYVHPGWGDSLFLKELFPNATIIGLLEYFYHSRGADVGFDPEFPVKLDDLFRIRMLNTVQLHALHGCDRFLSPTAWQRSRYPEVFHERIEVLHEGIDLSALKPDLAASLALADSTTVQAGQEILTYVSRGLEHYRGFHVFMRALPEILRRRPECRVFIVGDDSSHYGPAAPAGTTWREHFLREVGGELDMTRVHFTGVLGYGAYQKLLQLSRLHVYLTYPFVLSWSMLEAMATGCILLASDTEPVREVVRDGQNGLLFPFFSPEILAAKAVEVLSDPDLYLPLREAARATIRDNYDFDGVVYPRHLAMLEGLRNR